MNDVLAFLDTHNIEYELHEHEALFTAEQAIGSEITFKGLKCKNLFLKTKTGGNYYLYSLPLHKRADLKKLAVTIGVSRLSFANEGELMAYLQVTPGSVSPFCLLHDSKGVVEYYLDSDVAEADVVAFHPNINTATLDLKQEGFRSFLKLIGREIHIIKV